MLPITFFCESSIKCESEIIILKINGPRQVGKPGKSQKVCDGSGSWAKENEILKNFMLQGFQSTGKCTTSKRSYILKSTSYSPIHAVLVIITGWHNQPHFTLLPPMQHHRPPSLPLPTTILQGTG